MKCPRCQGFVSSELVIEVMQEWIHCVNCGHLAPPQGFYFQTNKNFAAPKNTVIEKINKDIEREKHEILREQVRRIIYELV